MRPRICQRKEILTVFAEKYVVSTEENMIINSYATILKSREVGIIGGITNHIRKEITRTWQTT